jgi:hypothetical protein
MMTCLALVTLGGGRSSVPDGAQRWRAALGAVHGCQNSESDLSHVRPTCGGRVAQRPSASIRPVWCQGPGHVRRRAMAVLRKRTHTQHTAHRPRMPSVLRLGPVLTRMREKRPSASPPSSPSVRSVGQAVESERALPVLAEAILDAGRVGTLECRSRMRLGEGLGCWDQANLRSVLMRAGWDRGRGVWGRVCTSSF